MMESAIRIGTDANVTSTDGCINLLLGSFKLRHPNMINLVYTAKSNDLSPSGLAAAVINKLYEFSGSLYEYVLDEQFLRDGNDSFTPKVHTVNIKSFFEYCFDGIFQSRSLKAFTVSNYGQKLLNELENSTYSIDDIKVKKLLRELGTFANHRTNTTVEIYSSVLFYYLDPRILIGFCFRNGLDYKVYYPPSRIEIIGNWLINWINNDNFNTAKHFKYDQVSLFLNYKSINDLL
jgi:hypothetical protein